MHMNQVAIAYRTSAERLAVIQSLGLQDAEWIKDRVTAAVLVLGRHGDYVEGTNVAELEFCMAMGGTQFELIRYVDGPNWISEAARIGVTFPMVAHVGFHLEEGEDWPPIVENGVLAQEAMTIEHSNPDVNEAGRRYHYRIYRVGTGAYFKFIKRLTVGKEAHEPVAGLEMPKVTPLPEHLRHVVEAPTENTSDLVAMQGEQVGGFMPAQEGDRPLESQPTEDRTVDADAEPHAGTASPTTDVGEGSERTATDEPTAEEFEAMQPGQADKED